MLLEAPSRLHFTEVLLYYRREHLLSTIKLTEACCKTLVKLSHKVATFGKSHPSSQSAEITVSIPFPDVDGCETSGGSFDFSKFPNLREVTFAFKVSLREGGLPWISVALSTLRPATSPRLFSIQLDFIASPIIDRSVETLIKETGGDLQRVADEVARIEREFEGALNFTVVPDSKFEVVLSTLNVRFPFAVLMRP